MFEFHFLCAGLKHSRTQSSSLQLHVRRTPDLRSLSNGRQVSGPQPGAGDKEALRCPLTLEQHIQVSQLLPMEPTRGLFPNPPTFHPFISAICCDLLFLEDAIIFSGKNKYACSVNQSSLTLWWPHGLYPHQAPPGKNTGVGCHFLFQGIFLIQGLNPCLLHWQVDSLTELPGKPKNKYPLP